MTPRKSKARRDQRTLGDAARAAYSRLRRYSCEVPQAVRHARLAIQGDNATLQLDPLVLQAPLAAAWLGHATVLVRLGDQWILTDPVMSHRIGIPIGPVTIGLGRLLPAVDMEHLPPIDLALISHAHFDHLDKPTLKRLARNTTRVITALNTGRLIPRGFAQVDELAWEREISVGPLTLRAIQPRHWGARMTVDQHRGYNSYLIDSPAKRVLFAGDTALTDCYAPLSREPRSIDLSIFGIGAYDPWIHNHASPEQAWTMHRQSGARFMLPMHHSTFKLSDEPREEPMQRLLLAAGADAPFIIGRELGRLWMP